MLLKFNPHRLFFISILFSGFLGYIFNSGIIAYGPLIIMAGLVIVYEIVANEKIAKKHIFSFVLFLPYVAWASFVYISNPFEGRYLSTHFLTILILPLLVLSFSRMLYGGGQRYNYKFIYKSLLIFVFLQLVVCLGQISTYAFGVGLPVNELYAEGGMVTGTFFNSNNLAAATLAILFFVLGLEKYFFKEDKYIFWIIAFTLLIITGSRSAIILGVGLFVFSKVNDPKKILTYGSLFFILALLSVFFIGSIENKAVSRMLARVESLVNVLQYGVSADNSMTMRINSYFHFLEKLPNLGLASGEINNYFKYSDGANFRGADLLFQNPHSLIVEMGYWLGWPGLVLFFGPMVLLLSNSRRKLSLIATFLIVSMIPSSILGSMLFFLILILSFFDFKSLNKIVPPAVTSI